MHLEKVTRSSLHTFFPYAMGASGQNTPRFHLVIFFFFLCTALCVHILFQMLAHQNETSLAFGKPCKTVTAVTMVSWPTAKCLQYEAVGVSRALAGY